MPKLAPSHVVSEHLHDMGMGGPTVKPDAKREEIVEARFNVRG
jgi:hypothetical protein